MPPVVVIPTYNESDNISKLVKEILELPITAHVIVVDDNSPDGTGKLVDEMASQDSRIHPVHRPAKLGLGTAHIAGMRQAFDLDLEPIVTMDADFSHHPRYIPALLAGLEHSDVMIGSRYVPHGGTRFFSLQRIILSQGANALVHLLVGLRATDCTAGFRAYRRPVLDSLDLDCIFSNGYSFLIELLFLCQRNGWRIGETPIIYEDRRAGKSKISKKEIFKATYTVSRLFLRRGKLRTQKALGRRAGESLQ